MSEENRYIEELPQTDVRFGRQIVHDPRSRDYPLQLAPLTALPTEPIRHRIVGPAVTPSQRVGCCTGVDQMVKANADGNRVDGVILGMAEAERCYSRASAIDPFRGQWPPTDTGSSGLAACKAAKEQGIISRYEWVFAGARQILAALAGDGDKPGRCVGVGTRWYDGMLRPDRRTLLVSPRGQVVGGHQWTITGWDPELQAFEGLCWWGPQFGDNGRFKIRLNDLDRLLREQGDAHVTYRAGI